MKRGIYLFIVVVLIGTACQDGYLFGRSDCFWKFKDQFESTDEDYFKIYTEAQNNNDFSDEESDCFFLHIRLQYIEGLKSQLANSECEYEGDIEGITNLVNGRINTLEKEIEQMDLTCNDSDYTLDIL